MEEENLQYGLMQNILYELRNNIIRSKVKN